MEIDEKQLQEFLLFVIDQLYKARKELVAYQVAHTFLSAAGVSQEFDQLLKQAQMNPSPALFADHQKARDTIAKLLTSGKLDDALEFLRNWNPKGPVN